MWNERWPAVLSLVEAVGLWMLFFGSCGHGGPLIDLNQPSEATVPSLQTSCWAIAPGHVTTGVGRAVDSQTIFKESKWFLAQGVCNHFSD